MFTTGAQRSAQNALAEGQFNSSGGRWVVALAAGTFIMDRMDRLQVLSCRVHCCRNVALVTVCVFAYI